MFRLRTPKFINLKSDPSLFTTNVKSTEKQASPQLSNANQELNAFITTSPKAPWTWWSIVMWVIFALGVGLVMNGFYNVLKTKNVLAKDGVSKDKVERDITVAILVIGFVFCFLPFIVSIIAGIRMF